VGRLRCRAGADTRIAAHVEIFARRRVVAIPPGIGVAPPRRRDGAFVRGGRCVYPASTRDPTGVIEVVAGAGVTLGDLFDIWGRPLSHRRIAGFRARRGDRVRAYVAGREWRGEVRAIPLRDHAQIVLEIAGHVPPHRSYRFPPG
jgi:hypothetical protein